MSKADQAEATRAALVRVGRQLFEAQGFDGVAAEEIVAAAQITRGALYHHFPDGKKGLFRAVVVEVMAETCAALERSGRGAGGALDGIARGVRAFLDALDEPGRRRILLVDGPAVLGWHEWRSLDLAHGLGLLRRGLETAASAGEIESDPETAAHLLGGALLDAAMLIGREPRHRRRVEATLLRLLRGLSTR